MRYQAPWMRVYFRLNVMLCHPGITAAKFVYYEMANNPEYVKELIIKRNQSEAEGKYDLKLFNLFSYCKIAPGTQMDGRLNESRFIDWYRYAENIENDRISERMMRFFGKMIYHVKGDEDGFVVNRFVAEFIENNADRNILQAFEMEAINTRGAINVSPWSNELKNIIDDLKYRVEQCENEGYLTLSKSYRNILELYRAHLDE